MVAEPSGCIRPSGRVLRAQCPVSSEQTRAEATRPDEVEAAADGTKDAQQRVVRAIGARVLCELFGSEDRPLPSLYALLDARLRACRPAHGDLRALAPCDEVNLALGRMVAIIQGDYGIDTDGALASRELEHAVRVALVQQIRSEPGLRERAQRLRRVAGLAEAAMEQHYSGELLAQLQAARTPFVSQPAGALRTALLERCLIKFPYMRNYRLLTATELRLLEHPAPPLLLRAAHCQRLSPAQRQRLEAELLQLRRLAVRDHHPVPWHTQTVAVCGAGPLPVTGLMLHTWTGARVSLYERNHAAVEVSRALVAELERLQVLEAGAVQVIEGDVALLTPRAEVVVVASLVDNAAKLQLVEHLREASAQSGLTALLLRSASSICAELAYEPVDTLRFSDPSLPFCGESASVSDLTARTERLVSSAREVLNDTELYRPLHRLRAQSATAGWLRDLLAQLRAATPPREDVL